MRKIIKKISSIAMAIIILGGGTTITKNVSLKSNHTLTVSAASCLHHGYRYSSKTNWITYNYIEVRTVYIKCGSCGKTVDKYYEVRPRDFDGTGSNVYNVKRFKNI